MEDVELQCIKEKVQVAEGKDRTGFEEAETHYYGLGNGIPI